MRKIYLLFFLCLFSIVGSTQVNIISSGSAVTQDFNTLASSGTSNVWTDNTTILGWYASTTTYRADAGGSNTGALYSYGAASNSERSLGAVTSSGVSTVRFGVQLRNTTGSTITSFNVSYIGEQWRQTTNAQKLVFEYSTDATSLATGTWTPVTALDFTAIKTGTAGALDGNDAANRATISGSVVSGIPNNSDIWFRWTKTGTTSPGLAIDDFSVTANSGASAPSVSSAVASAITTSTATLEANVLTDGGSAITARGFVWSTTNTDPNIGGAGVNNIVEGGTTTGVYSSNLASLPSGTTVYFKGYATNATGTAYTGVANFSTLKLEPSDHVTNFACGTTTSFSIPLTWTAPTGTTLPDAYLIRWSTVDFASVTDPIDGTFVTNSSGNLNVAAGAQTVTIVGLSQNTTYYFKIYPYTNSGSNVNYKTDGTIPQTSCATIAGQWEEFEVGSKTGYAAGNVTLNSGSWNFSEALIGNSASDNKNGNQAARLRTDGVISMNFDIPTGVGYVTVNHGTYGTDVSSTWHLEASTDGGTSWTAFVGPDVVSGTTLTAATFLVKTSSPVRLRILKTDALGGRLNIDDISYTAYSPTLPVRFTALKASQKTNGIELTWSNSTEENVVNYAVERSSNGRSFSSVGELNARANNGGKVDYNFVDAAPLSGDNFYRIKAVETTGKTIYSNIVRMNPSKKGTDLVVYPNPLKGSDLNVQFSNLPAGKYTIKVIAMNGQEIESRLMNHSGGNVSETINLKNLKPGIYGLQVNGQVSLTKTFVAE